MSGYKRADSYTKAAKAKGFPARSVFKLEDIDRRTRILRPNQRVLDLGAAPGSWSLYASQKIGAKGQLLAVDLQPLAQVLPPNCTFVQADIYALDRTVIAEKAPYDVIISDMAPNTTGDRFTDQTRSYELVKTAIEIAKTYGAKGSSFVAKIFMGGDFPEARKILKAMYGEERVIRPPAVRSQSFEVFLVGLNKREPPVKPGTTPTEHAPATSAPTYVAAPPTLAAPVLLPPPRIPTPPRSSIESSPREENPFADDDDEPPRPKKIMTRKTGATRNISTTTASPKRSPPKGTKGSSPKRGATRQSSSKKSADGASRSKPQPAKKTPAKAPPAAKPPSTKAGSAKKSSPKKPTH